MTEKPTMWMLDEALCIIRTLQPMARQFDYRLCLGGGVLNAGSSRKDLDLYFVTLGKPGTDINGLHKVLRGLWGYGVDMNEDGRYDDIETGYTGKWKFTFTHGPKPNKRIDMFVLG